LIVVVNKNNADAASHTTDLSKTTLKEMDIVKGLQLLAQILQTITSAFLSNQIIKTIR
jgi:hypothetical protein